jgi:histidinol-phosphate aminotransferase
MTDKAIQKLVRPGILSLKPYSSARDEYKGREALFLDANENPYNAPYNRYPDPKQRELKQAISEVKGIASEHIFVGNGSDEAIDLLFRVFCEPGVDNVVAIAPTYGMYQVCADINHVEYRKAPLKDDFSLDAAAIIQACDERTKMIFICSPNNPTSNSFDARDILSLAEQNDSILVLDEAYIDFSGSPSLKDSLSEYKNLVILQTFSKAWGLAGIRLGVALADKAIIGLMSKVKYPYNLNMLTQDFALKALKNEAKMKEWVDMILSERKRLARLLRTYRFVEMIFPSDANFLLVKVRKPIKVYNYLVEKKIIVRDRSNVALCEDSLRITVGSSEENTALSTALMNYQRDFVESCEI